MQFKVGQKVRVKAFDEIPWDDERHDCVNGLDFNDVNRTKRCCGKIYTIRSCEPRESHYIYHLFPDTGYICWMEEMLEPLNHIPTPFELKCLVKSTKFDLAILNDVGDDDRPICSVILPEERSGELLSLDWGELSVPDDECGDGLIDVL